MELNLLFGGFSQLYRWIGIKRGVWISQNLWRQFRWQIVFCANSNFYIVMLDWKEVVQLFNISLCWYQLFSSMMLFNLPVLCMKTLHKKQKIVVTFKSPKQVIQFYSKYFLQEHDLLFSYLFLHFNRSVIYNFLVKSMHYSFIVFH